MKRIQFGPIGLIVVSLFSLGVGVVLGGTLMYQFVAEDKYEFGYHQGNISGQLRVIDFLEEEFGDKERAANPPEDLYAHYGAKDRGFTVVTRNGVITIDTDW